MSKPRRSNRFSPTAITENIVPIFLVILLMILLAVIVVVVLSLFGVIPTA
jgi:hypothetical protein